MSEGELQAVLVFLTSLVNLRAMSISSLARLYIFMVEYKYSKITW